MLYSYIFAESLENAYCLKSPSRETIYIIDKESADKKLFGRVIKNSTYSPHEKVKIYSYNDSKVLEPIYSFCIPGYSNDEIKEFQKRSFLKKLFKDDEGIAEDDKAILLTKLTKKLIQLKEDMDKNSTTINEKIINPMEIFNNNLSLNSRIGIFTEREIGVFENSWDFNLANISIYTKRVKKSSYISKKRDQLFKCHSYLKGYFNLLDIEKKYQDLKKYEIEFEIVIDDLAIKSNIIVLVDDRDIESGWIQINGVLEAPIKGRVSIKNSKIISLNAVILSDLKYHENIIKKGDKIDLKLEQDRYIGSYYNNTYRFKNNRSKEFRYLIK
jgi:hypothetical protein